MSLDIDNSTGTIQLYQGDSGSVFVNNLDPQKSYRVYMAVYDAKRRQVGEELMVEAHNVDFVEFVLLSSFTALFEVPLAKENETYYYGIKLNEIGTINADTVFIAGGTYGDLNELIVYPRKVKGYLEV